LFREKKHESVAQQKKKKNEKKLPVARAKAGDFFLRPAQFFSSIVLNMGVWMHNPQKNTTRARCVAL
jgi:hypothetical protein